MSYGSTRGLTDVRLVEIRVLSSRVRVPEHTITNNTVACNINSLQLWVLVNGGGEGRGIASRISFIAEVLVMDARSANGRPRCQSM